MRFVRRKVTRLQQPRPPWEWRPTASEGPPRVLLSNHKDLITVPLGEAHVVVGKLDWMLRLYQHHGATTRSALQEIDGETYVVYEGSEWERVEPVAEWLELVNRRTDTVCRTGIRSGRKYGCRIDLPRGKGWAVPLAIYSTHTQE